MAEPTSNGLAQAKLIEVEHHFNQIEAGFRALASVWLLASLGAVAILLRQTERADFVVNPELAMLAISAGTAIGLAVLWLVDQFVYQRLLDAAFILGIELEAADHRLTPIHTMQAVAIGPVAASGLLRFFYLAPIAAHGLIGSWAAARVWDRSEDVLDRVAATGLAAIPILVIATVFIVGRHVGYQGSLGGEASTEAMTGELEGRLTETVDTWRTRLSQDGVDEAARLGPSDAEL